ncbi:MAG: hypothetical protein WD928_12765 [Gammaproteobacteria bacterium]
MRIDRTAFTTAYIGKYLNGYGMYAPPGGVTRRSAMGIYQV